MSSLAITKTESQQWKKLYNNKLWYVRRDNQLRSKPLCERCLSEGRVTLATVVHHIIPHKGNRESFLKGALASSCKQCHDSIEQSIERIGYNKQIGIDGWPIDPANPAYDVVKKKLQQIKK